ncbi:A/G-specific adenine glycosylase [Bacteriovorax sp. Seq25_V]|uniref:A/G-specific adenine glycosylase n=1 Tax=Bacteriovorax sp. Seq25_V TaxID=1201288 RepID=UPI000389E2FF|nr:A/G-specific adenine glycosylase [Bacteriovorax sp. Seq25_V]EQC46837.1 putative A/G-specific adenine glycosylase [Bacteriovorax sp. Seq25_V]
MYSNLIKWSKENYSHLPWRTKRSLYGTLVSEIMLQQTTVQTVLNHFDRFLKEYPTIKKLAAASEEEVCISWKGLGYYRRARNLRKAAIDIVENFSAKIPVDYDQLTSISGIGDYTASAIIAIGNNDPAIAIDANLERVLARIYGIKEKKGPALNKKLKNLFVEKIQFEKVDWTEFNEALMDLGRTFCQARKASCDICPMNKNCVAYKSKNPLEYPELQESKVKKYFELDLVRFFVQKNGQILGYVKGEQEWLSGQVELPTFVLNSEDGSLAQYPNLKSKIALDEKRLIKTSITKYKIKNYIVECSHSDFQKISKDKKFQFYKNEKTSNFATSATKVMKYVAK